MIFTQLLALGPRGRERNINWLEWGRENIISRWLSTAWRLQTPFLFHKKLSKPKSRQIDEFSVSKITP